MQANAFKVKKISVAFVALPLERLDTAHRL
jgi:hypothetical protein